MGKNALWQQTSASPTFSIENSASQSVDAEVSALAPWDLVLVRSEGTAEELVLTRAAVDDGLGFVRYHYGGNRGFPSRIGLDAAFPDDATYRFAVVPDDGSSGSIAFSAPPAGTIPHFTNFDAIRRIDPTRPFRFEWNAWEGAAGANGYIPFNVREQGGQNVIGVGLSRSETGYELPAFTLIPGKTYVATVNFSSGMFGAGTDWDGQPIGHQFWNYRTEVTFSIPLTGYDIAYQIDKHSHWRQTVANPAFTLENAAETFTECSLTAWPQPPWDSVRVTLTASGYELDLARYEYDDPVRGPSAGFVGRGDFPIRAALDATFPDYSDYRFEGLPGGSGSAARTFEVPPPGSIPRFSNFAAIQTLSPCQPLRFEWDSWLGAAAEGSYIHFNIRSENWGHHPVAVVLPRTATGFEVEGNSLIPGLTYVAVVGFTSGRYGNEIAWEGTATGWQVWEYRTEATFTVRDSDLPPVAGEDTLAVAQDTSVAVSTLRLMLNDFDPDCAAISLVSVANGSHGTAALAGGMVTYTPAAGYSGADRFTYQVSDGTHQATGAVDVTVRAAVPGANMIGAVVGGGDVLVRFGGISGWTYLVQHATSISGPWSDLPGPVTIPALGNVGEYLHVGGAGLSGFYRTLRP